MSKSQQRTGKYSRSQQPQQLQHIKTRSTTNQIQLVTKPTLQKTSVQQMPSTPPVEKVKKQVEQEKLPWIILSEELTKKAGQPAQSEFYAFYGLPNMCLVDKEGKIIMQRARGDKLQVKLREIFE